MYGLLAEAGRGEDNAAQGGQVAHISAAEADLLKQLGGAGSVNPTTGLPEYYSTGASSAPGTAAAATAAAGSAAAAGGLGVSPSSGGSGFGFGVTSGGGYGGGQAGSGIGLGATASPGGEGLGFLANLGEGQGNYGQSMGDGGFSPGGFLSAFLGDTLGLLASPFGKFANQYGLLSSLSQSVLGDSAVTSAIKGMEGFSNQGRAVPTVNVPPNSPSLSPTPSPYGPFGDTAPTSLVTPNAEAAVVPTSLNTPLPYSPLPTTLV